MTVFFDQERPDGATSHVCAICVTPILGTPHREQLDPGGPLYVVCEVCATEHPRSGRYSFDDASKVSDGYRDGHSHRSLVGKAKARM